MNISRITLKTLICVSALVILAACTATPKNVTFVPDQETAQDQYLYAYDRKMNVKRDVLADEVEVKEDYEKVLVCFERVIERFPDDERFTPLAYLSIGDIYLKLNEPDKAEKTFDYILNNVQDDEALQAAALLGKSRSLIKQDRFEEARLKLRKCINTYENSKNESVQNYVIKCRRQLLLIESK